MTVETDRLPPCDQQAERCVLGSMLRDNAVIADILQVLRAEDLYADASQTIFRAITELYDRGHPVDVVTLADALREAGRIEDIGGYGYLGDLWDVAPTAANGAYYARIVREKAICRNLIHASTETLRDAYQPSEPADQLLEAAEKRIFAIADAAVSAGSLDTEGLLRAGCDRIDACAARGRSGTSGLPTGFLDLDDRTAGLQPQELAIIAARPSIGKTSLALNIAYHVSLREAVPVFFVSLEQSAGEIGLQLLCLHGQVDRQKVRKGWASEDELCRLTRAKRELSSARIFFDGSPGQTMLRIGASARRHRLRHRIGLVVVDYLQLVEPDSRKDPRHEQVGGISRKLKRLSKELQIPVLALAQLNRKPEDRTDARPRLSDLRESGSLEMDADTVMLMHRPEKPEPGDPVGLIEIDVAKQRNGPTGEVKLVFRKDTCRFENYAPAPQGFGP